MRICKIISLDLLVHGPDEVDNVIRLRLTELAENAHF